MQNDALSDDNSDTEEENSDSEDEDVINGRYKNVSQLEWDNSTMWVLNYNRFTDFLFKKKHDRHKILYFLCKNLVFSMPKKCKFVRIRP